ncbi:tRNA (guanosine(37)-N1)-methyltransferase TrmD [Nocardioides terrisoli]|uniref:tRNA (guanosine(37)-N1)-methyltransferase TrmD n=1 Tax=Nocardioides terrisoli TaxID=3388267 RepID=UPI00287B63C4|nr:tRNA (guanosine(37)-N1)-methyltransferase TrmD [Nocardioides marmorisolisilvae]
MRIDVVSIFPDYFAPLGLSLPGKAISSGLLDLQVHDLRGWTHDRHRTVDDTPTGGGAGMVMKPEPWGEALDQLATAETVLVVPTPAGERFTQAVAGELAGYDHLLFVCGRYEGIDQRVVEEASGRMSVRELSLGDYVLNGGEVAALAMIEAVVRLLPGFMGNAESLAEESHSESGLLEYPVYTRPASWRGRDVPEVLLSGDHARIAAWRHDQALRRTAQRRPDLLHGSQMGEWEVASAVPADAGELLTLQLACWVAEQQANPDVTVPALHESLADVRAWLGTHTVLVVRAAGRLVGGVRGMLTGETWEVGRLMVAPDLRGRGLGRELLARIEALAPAEATRFVLFTGAGSSRNLRMYQRAGYRPRGQVEPGVLRLSKPRRESPPG